MASSFPRPASYYPDSSHSSFFWIPASLSQDGTLLVLSATWEMLLVNHLYIPTNKSELNWETILSSDSVKKPNFMAAEACEWLFAFGQS